jgi:hypothetical protein
VVAKSVFFIGSLLVLLWTYQLSFLKFHIVRELALASNSDICFLVREKRRPSGYYIGITINIC